MIREDIKKILKKSITSLQGEKKLQVFDIPEIKAEHSEGKGHGDYSSNISFELARRAKKNPLEIANLLNKKLQAGKSKFFEKVEVAKPGFLNFFLSQSYLQSQLEKVLKLKKLKKRKKINIEFVSANPTGPLHLGHGRGAFWGDTLANVFEKAGHKVTREYFINDHGNQILLLGKSIDARYLEQLGEKQEIKEDFYKGEYIKDIANEIIKKDGEKYVGLSEEKRVKIFTDIGIQKMVENAKKLLKRVGVTYDVWFSEKTLYQKGLVKKAIKSLEKKNYTYQKDGALWFPSTKFKDDKDRILIKSDGEPTYFATDIAYHLHKVSRKYDLLINGWGSDHWGYVQRLIAAAHVFGFDKKLKIVVGQFVRLVEGGKELKMSKREGNFVSLKDLIDEVGVDVTRFFFIMKSVDTHIDFNMALAKEQSNKNPVYYVQYAHARMCSIFKKSKNFKKQKAKVQLLNHPSELHLMKECIRFPEIIEDTSKDYQIQRIPQYAMDLAAAFHQFYRDCHVLSEDKELTNARLYLILVTKNVLQSTLDLIGISSPEKM